MTFLIPTRQVIIMFILMIIGWLCYMVKFLHEQTSKDLTKILLYVVSPCLIINSFKQKLTSGRLIQFGLLLVLITFIFIFKILLSRGLFSGIKNPEEKTVLKYAGTYTNAGFMGIPLVQAILGSSGVFFAVPYLICYNVFMWTHGINMFQKNHSTPQAHLRQVLTNPNIIAAIIGLLLFITQVKIPTLIATPMNYIADINTPLSMIVIGTNLGSINLKRDLVNPNVWFGVLVRNLFFPLCVLGMLMIAPLVQTAKLAVLIMASCPVAGVVVLFSLMSGYDVKFPTKLMCISTLVAILTIPLMIFLGMLVFG